MLVMTKISIPKQVQCACTACCLTKDYIKLTMPTQFKHSNIFLLINSNSNLTLFIATDTGCKTLQQGILKLNTYMTKMSNNEFFTNPALC